MNKIAQIFLVFGLWNALIAAGHYAHDGETLSSSYETIVGFVMIIISNVALVLGSDSTT